MRRLNVLRTLDVAFSRRLRALLLVALLLRAVGVLTVILLGAALFFGRKRGQHAEIMFGMLQVIFR